MPEEIILTNSSSSINSSVTGVVESTQTVQTSQVHNVAHLDGLYAALRNATESNQHATLVFERRSMRNNQDLNTSLSTTSSTSSSVNGPEIIDSELERTEVETTSTTSDLNSPIDSLGDDVFLPRIALVQDTIEDVRRVREESQQQLDQISQRLDDMNESHTQMASQFVDTLNRVDQDINSIRS